MLHVESQVEGDPQLGRQMHLRTEVALNGLHADDVVVEAVFGSVDAEDRITDYRTLALARSRTATARAGSRETCHSSARASFGYTVRVLPHSDLLATASELGVVATA